MRRGMIFRRPFSLLALQALLAGGPADFAELESAQFQRSQLLLRTLTLSHAWDFNGYCSLLSVFSRRLWCVPIAAIGMQQSLWEAENGRPSLQSASRFSYRTLFPSRCETGRMSTNASRDAS
jgi:hypothetical protein